MAKQIELAKKLVTPIFMHPFSLPTVVAGIDAITATGKDLKHKLGRSRTFFGNTGRKANAPCRYKEKFFEGTHGALGGVHWPDVDGDEDCARKVGTWMLSCLMATGLKPIESLGT